MISRPATGLFSWFVKGWRVIQVELYSDDPELGALVRRYWAMGNDGKFLHSVASLLPYHGVSDGKSLLKLINDNSKAWNPENACSSCGGILVVTSRSAEGVRQQKRVHKCAACITSERQRLEDAAEAQRRLLREALIQAQERSNARRIDYAEMSDDIAMIVLALERAINPQLLSGRFRFGDALRLMPGAPDDVLKRLYEAGIIVDQPLNACAGTYWLQHEELWFNWGGASYSLVPDKNYGLSEEGLAYLANRAFVQHGVLRSLWLDYAVDDCMTYFSSQCSRYRLQPEAEALVDIASQVRSALAKYSIQQLWCALWAVVREAAALCNHEYYNTRKATATMPGKLQRLLEALLQGKRQPLKAWRRPEYQPAGTLGEMFFERYGINEATEGGAIEAIFATPEPDVFDSFLASPMVTEGLVDEVFDRIHENRLGGVSFAILAQALKGGADLEDAIALLIRELPVLQEGRRP